MAQKSQTQTIEVPVELFDSLADYSQRFAGHAELDGAEEYAADVKEEVERARDLLADAEDGQNDLVGQVRELANVNRRHETMSAEYIVDLTDATDLLDGDEVPDHYEDAEIAKTIAKRDFNESFDDPLGGVSAVAEEYDAHGVRYKVLVSKL